MTNNAPGQRYRSDFPRFGLDQFADRVVSMSGPWSVELGGEVTEEGSFDNLALAELERVEQVSDFHCVTTWSHAGARWSGYRFADVYREIITPRLRDNVDIAWLYARAHDGYRSRLLLEDALAADVLLADQLNGEPLGAVHGGPLRLVAPKHYGYKNAKHLRRLEFWPQGQPFLGPTPLRLMEHPRGRVALEERGGLPGVLLRWLYRPLVSSTVKRFARGLAKHQG